MVHVNSVPTHISWVLGPRIDGRELFLRIGGGRVTDQLPWLAPAEQQAGCVKKIWKDNLVMAKFPALFSTGPENICTEHSSLQAGYLEVSVSGSEETDGIVQIKQVMRRV